jgi:hypothetical protein
MSSRVNPVGWDDNPSIATHANAGIRLRLVPAYDGHPGLRIVTAER